MSRNNFYNSPRRFLLIRTDRIGDTILTLPTVTAIRENYPKAFIAFLSKPYTNPLVKQYEGIDLLLTYDPERRHKGFKGILRLIKELKKYKFDSAILFYPRLELAFAIFRAKIPVRIGTRYRWYSFFLNNHIYEHRKECKKHELEYNLNQLNPLIPRENLLPHYMFKTWNKTKWWGKFQEEIKFKNYAIVHPGSGKSAPNLNKNQYDLIVNLLLEKTDWTILITGTTEESRFICDLAKGFPKERVKIMVDRFSLLDFFSIVRNASLLIASSTGPLHMANAVNIPVLGFFCPVKPHTPTRWGPYNQQQWVVKPSINKPNVCNYKMCPHGGCLQKITNLEIENALCKKRLKNLQTKSKS